MDRIIISTQVFQSTLDSSKGQPEDKEDNNNNNGIEGQ
jgi:hypothetical protein